MRFRLAERFEGILERFLLGDLERRTRVLSWTTLLLLLLFLWIVVSLFHAKIPIQNMVSGQEDKITIRDLIFR
jgi:hypothetical protein